MKQVLIHKGAALVADVPAPQAGPGEVLVRVAVSCLSVGTEMSGLRASAVPLWKKALRQPQKVADTLRLATTLGVKRTWSLVQEKRDAAVPTGYSAAGTVVAVGDGVDDLAVGDRVACAGNQYAHHAEFVRVPRNLCVPLPEALDFEEGSTVTLGAIALQGVRRAEPTLGETFVVIGLGILGQLTVQLLRANGCRAIGVDTDPARVALAQELGLDVAINPGDDGDQVARLTGGLGADGVIITAATPSDEVVSTAFRFCRKKGRVVLVGDVGLNLNREDFYAKEIDFLISASYGPGRYDRGYEEGGLDYPAAFVRWTENRNMEASLAQLAAGRVEVAPLVSARHAVTDAPAAYASLAGAERPMMVLLTYPDTESAPSHRIEFSAAAKPGRIRVALVGAGSFARSTHLPNLQALPERFALHAVVTQNGHSAAAVAKQFGAAVASTDAAAVIADPEVDAVIIATRHHLHAELARAALAAGKHVLVEKPLALDEESLGALDAVVSEGGPVLLTGYNRRFSPYADRLRKILADRYGPMIINYRMNAGFVPDDHWVHGAEGGGRNLGEACHIYDLFTALTDAEAVRVSAQTVRPGSGHYRRDDNFVATIEFADGSLATLTYTALGHKAFPKESADIFCDGKAMRLVDYKSLEVAGGAGLTTRLPEKGLAEELVAFADAVNGGAWPIPWWQQLQVARIALAVESQLHG
ncbi:MAG: bi-domain-containing oxidoreductase [Gammaproteobacteria bacterium]